MSDRRAPVGAPRPPAIAVPGADAIRVTHRHDDATGCRSAGVAWPRVGVRIDTAAAMLSVVLAYRRGGRPRQAHAARTQAARPLALPPRPALPRPRPAPA